MERPSRHTSEQNKKIRGFRNRIGEFVVGLGSRMMGEDHNLMKNGDQCLSGSVESLVKVEVSSGTHDDLSQESSMCDGKLTRAELIEEYQKVQDRYSDIDDLSGFGDVDLGSGIYAATSSPFVGDGVIGAQIKRDFLKQDER